MFAQQARNFIEKLIHIQKQIARSGYMRSDQDTLAVCLNGIEKLLKYWTYSSSEKMAAFWINHRAEIRYLVPTAQYAGFKTLLAEFDELDKQSQVIEFQSKIFHRNKPATISRKTTT